MHSFNKLSKIIGGLALGASLPVQAQFAAINNIDVKLNTDAITVVTLKGEKPSDCFEVYSDSVIQDRLVTIDLMLRFPFGQKACRVNQTPFTVAMPLTELSAGEYQVEVNINGVHQEETRSFRIDASQLSYLEK